MTYDTSGFFTVWLRENKASSEITQSLRAGGNSRVAVIQLGEAAINPPRACLDSAARTPAALKTAWD